MSSEEIMRIAGTEVQSYLFDHALEDEKKLVLQHKLILGLPASLIAQQIASRRKAEAKIPTFFQTKGIIYPPAINVEQSSSEATAKFKREIFGVEIKEPTIADLTGGLGIDSFFLSRVASVLDYVEPDHELSEIALHNFRILERHNIRVHNRSAEGFLNENSNRYDLIYLDPSRRDSNSNKVFVLSDCAPSVSQLLPRLLERTNFILLKASPLLDIKQGLKELSNVKKVAVVSVANECKELLFLIEENFCEEPIIQTFNLDRDGKIKHAFEFYFSEEMDASSEFSQFQKYLYEPNASILKAGAFKKLGERLGIKKISVNTHLYTSDLLIQDFPGRIFEIDDSEPDARSLEGEYVNIITRNYPLSPDNLKKKLKTKDGGEKYIVAFSGPNKKHMVTARRLA
ncbi:MAG TPA: hypothetical protein VL728_20680 [Cyclobacteriaceae bacterium]|jgi:16S rRNA G966 N2-methylase RsmD|nr:hypothetical protein [Cyclobacteriaceae bacterium]